MMYVEREKVLLQTKDIKMERVTFNVLSGLKSIP